jgi:hypothetical protein
MPRVSGHPVPPFIIAGQKVLVNTSEVAYANPAE